MINKNKVVVVEGYHDLAKLLEIYPEMDIIITNGSEITKDTLEELKILNKTRGLILFLDPDYQGERIRRIINEYVGDTQHAFLEKKKCISKNKKKVGIEHANKDDIKDALSKLYTSSKNREETILLMDLYRLDLIGTKNAKKNRERISRSIGIGLSNGKTLHKKLNMFGITKAQIEVILGK